MIRLFHGGEDGAHDYRLYNVSDDVGETNNLASTHSDKVKKLDQLIEEHLKDANAVVPLPNPKFDPEQYAPEKIGVGRRKSLGKRKSGGQSNATAGPRAETLFKRRDTNKDSRLSIQELKAAMKGK